MQMAELTNDIRYAMRQLRKSPGFTLTALLTLALGIGVTAAVFSVIQTVLLAPLPYPDQDRLVGVAFTYPQEKPNAEQAGASADFVREQMQSFSSSAVMDDTGPTVNLSVSGGRAIQVKSLRVSEGYFRTLGVGPVLGRAFLADEDRPGGAKAAVLSDGLWTRIFNRDPNILGRTIRVNEEPFRVVGVMPESFAASSQDIHGAIATPDLWQPIQLSPKDPGYDGDNYKMIARLRPGLTLEQVQQQLSALKQPFYERHPEYKKWYFKENVLHEFRAWKLRDAVVSDVRRSLLTVMGAVIAVLLVACLNLAGLMMSRALRRSREIALHSALGASHAQLMRMLACEGLLLALGGGVLALLVTKMLADLLLHHSPLAIPNLHGEPGGWTVTAVATSISLISMSIFSMLPAWFVLRRNGGELRLGSSSLGETISHARVSRALTIAQVALAMVLVSAASLLMGTFVKLQALPSGVDTRQLTVFQVTLMGDHYANTRRTSQFVQTVLDQLRRTPGVHRAAAANGLPLDRGLNIGANPSDRKDLRQIVEFRSITPGYFQTIGIPLRWGRDIAEDDRADGDPVVVIGATAAKRWWPGRSPIGDTIHVGGEQQWRVVGVVADVPMHSLVESQGIVIYAPMVQLSDQFTAITNGWFPTTFAVRAAAGVRLAQAAQTAVSQADPEIPVARLTRMQAVIDGTSEEPRFFSLLAASFSAFALLLTAIGIFGLLSYQVTQRTREIGVRMALGARRFGILQIFLVRGLILACIGIALGFGINAVMRPMLSRLLVDAGVDAANNAAASVVMNGSEATALSVFVILIVTATASWLPARRAASVEPMQALRAE